MATPHVAGALALLWQSFPEENAQQLRARVLGNTRTTEYTPALLPRFTLGTNQPEYPDYTWGYGVLDVYQAKNASEPEVTDPGAEEPETDAPETQEPSRSGSGGCSMARGTAAFDPTLPLLLILAALAVLRPRRVKGVL